MKNNRSYISRVVNSLITKAAGFTMSALVASILFTAATLHAQNVTVTGSTGADGSYVTVKAAFDALNLNGTQGGNTISISIIGNTTEAASAVLNQPSVSSWTSLTISPSGGAVRTVSGTIAGGAVLNLNGADNVLID